jgi:serine/threonine protein kinase
MTGFAPEGTRLVERLGIGSVFEVALVRDERERELVCKRSAPHAKVDSGERALRRERDLLLAAKSPYFADLVEWGSDDRGEFLLEARAAGSAVRELVREAGPPVDRATWLELARAASRALSCLHQLRDQRGELRFVHGDVSPDNLFFERPAHATFIDLSSATFREGPDPVFPSGRGTLPYVAPEVARGEVRPRADSDTYALAATLLAVAVGPKITRATTEASRLLEVGTRGVDFALIDHRTDLPQHARIAIAKALRFEWGGRLASSGELADELEKEVG